MADDHGSVRADDGGRLHFSALPGQLLLLQHQLLVTWSRAHSHLRGSENFSNKKTSIIYKEQLKIWRSGGDMDSYVGSSIPDPWRFYTKPHSRLRTTGLRFRIRILLFSSMAFRMPTKYKFFWLFLTVDTFTSVFKENKLLRNQKTVEIMGFLNFFVCWWEVWIRTNTCWSGSSHQPAKAAWVWLQAARKMAT